LVQPLGYGAVFFTNLSSSPLGNGPALVLDHTNAAWLLYHTIESDGHSYLWFSAHNEAAAIKLLDSFASDSVLFPINYVCFAQGNFGPALLAKARAQRVPVLALKALAFTPWASREERKNGSSPKGWYRPIADYEAATAALRFTLSEGVTAAIPPGDERIYRLTLDLAAGFKPLTAAERTQLLASARPLKPIFRA
jgi:hypothetical protein